MQTTTLSFNNLHNYGELFANVFRARRQTFIVQNNWDLPEADGMEFDQYDTPASRWIAVHDGSDVLAGVRLTPTTARCGIYSYMIRDAQRGLLDTIPSTLMFDEAPVSRDIWESSRIFVSHRVEAEKRFRVQLHLIAEMTKSARDLGASSVIGLIPENGPRWGRRVGLDISVAGPVLDIAGARSVCVNINMATSRH